MISDTTQIPGILAQLRTCDKNIDPIVVSTSSGVSLSAFKSYPVRFYALSHYISKHSSIIDKIATEVISTRDGLEKEKCFSGKKVMYHGVALWSCLVPEITFRYIQPIIQAIWAFQQMIKLEYPDEIWVSKTSRWSCFMPVLVGSGPDWLGYNILYPFLLQRVAAEHKVPIRGLSLSLSELAFYVLSRYIRPLAFQAYKFWHWFQTKRKHFYPSWCRS